MQLDIRIPTGLLFGIVGVIMVVFGIQTHFTNPTMYDRSLGINVNLWWGLCTLGFGAIMLALAWRAAKKNKPQ
jgi:hypothetical protein